MGYRPSTHYDAIVVGAGPNGLAAAITLARAGRAVLVLEAESSIGGGTRSAELTLPGFVHDICSAVHPLGIGSAFFRELPLHEYGLKWIHPPAPLAHPFDDGSTAVLERSVRATGATLGIDADAYWRFIAPIVRNWEKIAYTTHGPLRISPYLIALARFGMRALWPADTLAKICFRGEQARTLFAGCASHSILPLERAPSAAAGLVLMALAHTYGWPIPRGGSQQIANAMAAYLRSLGGEIVLGERVETMAQLPSARAVLFDVTPHQLLRIASDRLPTTYKRALKRYRYGPGVFKLDWALDGPIPWTARACTRAATIHLGGSLAEIAASERAVWHGNHALHPFVLLAQQSLFDSTRAPESKHTVWAYCHVPHGSSFDMTERIEAQIERFAPGFRDRILARSALNPLAMEQHNANYIGGDINGGVQDLWQLYTRPVVSLNPYATPDPSIYLCSSSTPPGGGVHGLCGYFAAQAALRAGAC